MPAQESKIGAAVPNPDGIRSNLSGDFTAQGVGNLAGGFFGALPVGGSLSPTGVATSAGAQTRWAGIFAGICLATTQLPLHTAILIGVITSLVLYCVKASQSAQLVALRQTEDGGWQTAPVPEQCASNDVTLLHYAGVGLFAEVGPHRRGVAESGGLHQCRRRAELADAARRACHGPRLRRTGRRGRHGQGVDRRAVLASLGDFLAAVI